MSTVVRNLPKVYSEETLVPTDVLEEIEAILSSEEFGEANALRHFYVTSSKRFIEGMKTP